MVKRPGVTSGAFRTWSNLKKLFSLVLYSISIWFSYPLQPVWIVELKHDGQTLVNVNTATVCILQSQRHTSLELRSKHNGVKTFMKFNLSFWTFVPTFLSIVRLFIFIKMLKTKIVGFQPSWLLVTNIKGRLKERFCK